MYLKRRVVVRCPVIKLVNQSADEFSVAKLILMIDNNDEWPFTMRTTIECANIVRQV